MARSAPVGPLAIGPPVISRQMSELDCAGLFTAVVLADEIFWGVAPERL